MCEPLGIVWLGLGMHPIATLEQAPRMPRERYAIMREYLGQRDELGLYMMHATAGVQAYLHPWREGDFIIWDERITLHCRVPYDAANRVREMWRMVFRIDPADHAFNETTPQLNLTHESLGISELP